MNCVGESWCADEIPDCAWGPSFFSEQKDKQYFFDYSAQRLKESFRKGRYEFLSRIFTNSKVNKAGVLLYSVEDELKTLEIAPQRIVLAQDRPVHKSSRALSAVQKTDLFPRHSSCRTRRLTGKKEGAQIKSPIASGSGGGECEKTEQKNSAGVSRLGLNWWLGICPSKFTHLEVLCSYNLESRAEHVSNADFQPWIFFPTPANLFANLTPPFQAHLATNWNLKFLIKKGNRHNNIR
jgi:hypothetical protein